MPQDLRLSRRAGAAGSFRPGEFVNVGYASPLGKAGSCLTTELRARNLYRTEPFKTTHNHSIEKARTVSKGNKGHNQHLSRFRALNDPVFERYAIPFSREPNRKRETATRNAIWDPGVAQRAPPFPYSASVSVTASSSPSQCAAAFAPIFSQRLATMESPKPAPSPLRAASAL